MKEQENFCPTHLYRGVVIDYSGIENYKFSGTDLVVNYKPIIDEYGRKTVKDGNEYGVYMTDNLNMVRQAYGNLHHNGTPIHSNLEIRGNRIMIPSVAVIYDINTEGLNVKRPFISRQLEGHYNNGFEGNEWITDVVPAQNYEIIRVRIGRDILHDAEDIDLTDQNNLSQRVKEKLGLRKYRLEIFANSMEQLSPFKRQHLGLDEMKLLKEIFGEHGVRYCKEDSLDFTKVEDLLTYLQMKIYQQNTMTIDFQTLKYLDSLRGMASDISSLIEILKQEKIKNMKDKISFEKRKEAEGIPYATIKFDQMEKRVDLILTLLLLKVKKLQPIQKQKNHQPMQLGSEEQEWEMVKRKYNYDELEFEQRYFLEQQFGKMVRERNNQFTDEKLIYEEGDGIESRRKIL